MNVLAVIPARGGSKGVPRKNLRQLGGKPLFAWTVEAAQAVNEIAWMVVSTEDAKIHHAALRCGAPVIDRPPELAQDETPMPPVLWHALSLLEAQRALFFDWVMCLQPTTPFRSADDIRAAIALAERGNCDSVISVVKVEDHHPARMYTIEDGYMEGFMPEYATKRRQDLPAVYLRNGAIYLTRRDVLERGRMWGHRTRALIMPEERSINIDTELDFLTAEALLVRN